MIKFTFIIILLSIIYSNIMWANAMPTIEEINFKGSEYVELISNETLDLEGMKVYDSKYPDIFNTLTLEKNSSSNLYLIIGEKFKEENDLNTLNCTIYVTDRSQVSNGGLKDSGEQVHIQYKNNSIISYNKSDPYTFKDNESLNIFNFSIYQLGKHSPCIQNTYLHIETNSTNETNFSIDLCNRTFDIVVDKDIFQDKIKFKYHTDIDNFELEYWVEDLSGEIVKSKRVTTNKNEKSYTPKDRTEVYTIFSEITFQNESCSMMKNKTVVFYSENENIQEVEVKEELRKLDSHIKFLNYEEFLNDEIEYVQFEVYKGDDTSKRKFYIYLNEELIFSNDILKYKESYFTLKPNLLLGLNKIVVKGLDLEDTYFIFKNKSKNMKKEKEFFNLTNVSLENNTVEYFIDSNMEELEGECYVNILRTLISQKVNLSKGRVNINSSKVREKKGEGNHTINFICKYKKKKNKTYNSKSMELGYNLKDRIFKEVQLEESIVNENRSKKVNISKEKEIIFQSESTKNKSKTIFGVIGGIITMLIGSAIIKST